jgi:hypothetical protein
MALKNGMIRAANEIANRIPATTSITMIGPFQYLRWVHKKFQTGVRDDI